MIFTPYFILLAIALLLTVVSFFQPSFPLLQVALILVIAALFMGGRA